MSGNQKQQQTGRQNQEAVKAKKTQQKTVKAIDPEQMLSAPETLRIEDVLAAQQQVGNQVVQRALDKKGRDRSVTDNQGNLNEDLTKQIQSKRGGGSPLPDSVQQDASKKLGRKFNDVRIHTDDTADQLSRSVSARAFTIGKDIFFKGGVFSPTTTAGRETLIHELTHVVQQSASKTSSGGKLKLGAPDTAMEKEAAHMGKKHATQFSAAAPVAGAVQRVHEEEDLLQGQPDANASIQREGEEEEMQMQPDANAVIQREGEEEEMQMQPDANAVIQREGEEEEMQMQPDANSVIQRDDGPEDELQMQPDAGGIVQRDRAEEIEALKKRSLVSKGTRRFSVPPSSKITEAAIKKPSKPLPAIPTSIEKPSKPLPAIPTSIEKPSKPLPAIPTSIKKPSKPLPAIPTSIKKPSKPLPKPPSSQMTDVEAARVKGKFNSVQHSSSPSSEIAKKNPELLGKAVFDPAAAKKEAAKAEKTQKKKNAAENKAKFKEQDAFKKRMDLAVKNPKKLAKMDAAAEAKAAKAKAASGTDVKDAKATASVDAKADPAKEEKNETSKSSKVGGMFKKGLGFLGSKVKGFVAGQVKDKIKDAKEHYTGKKEEEKTEDAKPAGVTVNVNNAGGGGGGGGGGMAETISDLYQENKQLKSENAELKKKKEEVPVV